MRLRLLFIVGLVVGYVLGARAGRPAYDALVDRVGALTGDPTVRKAAEQATSVLQEHAPEAAAALAETASTVTDVVAAATTAGEAATDEPTADDAEH